MFDVSHLHPMIVHFPIALLIVGFLADVLSLFLNKKEPCLSKVGFYLMILGTLSIIAAYITGDLFTKDMAGAAGDLKNRHELFARITMLVMLVALAVRIFYVSTREKKPATKWLAFSLFALGTIMVMVTGFLGGNLVYGHMVGL
jgi:uncharacterized membrane protein